MSDNFFVAESGSAATLGGQYVAPTVTAPQPLTLETSSLTELSIAIESSFVLAPYTGAPAAAPPLILDQAELSPEDRLQMYLSVARRSQHMTVMENAFTLALRTQRMLVNSSLSSTMPTALKIKTCEIPVLKLFLEFGLRSADWRALVVRMLSDNVQTGTGHLTVNRAKQVLKELAKKAGPKVLAVELSAETTERRMAAIILLGWLKNEKAIEPLVTAYDTAGQAEKKLILEMLESHYLPKLAYHLKWRHQSPDQIAEPLLALLRTA